MREIGVLALAIVAACVVPGRATAQRASFRSSLTATVVLAGGSQSQLASAPLSSGCRQVRLSWRPRVGAARYVVQVRAADAAAFIPLPRSTACGSVESAGETGVMHPVAVPPKGALVTLRYRVLALSARRGSAVIDSTDVLPVALP